MSATHDRSVIEQIAARFRIAESRLVFAAYRDDLGELFYLEDGAGPEHRELTRERLRCPVEECRQPEITVAAGPKLRHHFRHRNPDVNHSGESLFHVSAKGHLRRWAAAQPGVAAVGEEVASNEQRERIADVMVTLDGGQRVALEVQYSPISVEDWQRRTDSYLAQGITPVWVFGHTGHLRISADGVHLSELQQHMLENGHPLFWINPTLESVLTLELTPKDALYPPHNPRVTPLSAFTIHHRYGLGHPSIDPVHRAAVEELLRRRLQAQMEAASEARALERAAEYAKQVAAKRELIAEDRARLEEGWRKSGHGQAAVAKYGYPWPAYLNQVGTPEDTVPPVIWQTWALEQIIEPAKPGEVINPGRVREQVTAEFGSFPSADLSACSNWFALLAEARIVERVRGYGSRSRFYRKPVPYQRGRDRNRPKPPQLPSFSGTFNEVMARRGGMVDPYPPALRTCPRCSGEIGPGHEILCR